MPKAPSESARDAAVLAKTFRPKKTRHKAGCFLRNGGQGRNRTGVDGFAGRCMTTLPPGHCAYIVTRNITLHFKKQNLGIPRFCQKLERETRLELATPTLARSCSTN